MGWKIHLYDELPAEQIYVAPENCTVTPAVEVESTSTQSADGGTTASPIANSGGNTGSFRDGNAAGGAVIPSASFVTLAMIAVGYCFA